MVAIHIPRLADDRWVLDDAAGAPGPGGRHRPGPARAPGDTRRLPDRATRVRRRRLAVLMAAVALAGAGAVAVQGLAGMAQVDGTGPRDVEVQPVDDPAVPVAGQQYVVQRGDTLWSIAEAIAPDSDPRAVVDALREANGGPMLEVGTRLTLDID